MSHDINRSGAAIKRGHGPVLIAPGSADSAPKRQKLVLVVGGQRESMESTERAAAPTQAAAAAAQSRRSVPAEIVLVRGQDPGTVPAPQGQNPVHRKSADEIELEVQELVEKKLLGKDKSVRVAALRTLLGCFMDTDGSDIPADQRMEYRRALDDWSGFHAVLIALRQEIDSDEDPHRNVVFGAMCCVMWWWYVQPASRLASMRLKAIESISRGMQAFPYDFGIQRAAICCFYLFTLDNARGRREKLLGAGCVLLIVRAMTTLPADDEQHLERAIRVLLRLCKIGDQSHAGRLMEAGALAAASKAYERHRECAGSECKVAVAARQLVNKLFE